MLSLKGLQTTGCHASAREGQQLRQLLQASSYSTLDSMASWSTMWHLQAEHEYTRGPFSHCLNGLPISVLVRCCTRLAGPRHLLSQQHALAGSDHRPLLVDDPTASVCVHECYVWGLQAGGPVFGATHYSTAVSRPQTFLCAAAGDNSRDARQECVSGIASCAAHG